MYQVSDLFIIHCTYVLFPLSAANMRALKPCLLTILKSMPLASARRTMMASWLFSIASWRGVFSAASYMKYWTEWRGKYGDKRITFFFLQQYIDTMYILHCCFRLWFVYRTTNIFCGCLFSAVFGGYEKSADRKLQNIHKLHLLVCSLMNIKQSLLSITKYYE